METINIARLRNGLCGYLARVKAGEEFVVRDRNRPVARLVPFDDSGATAEELALVAAGQMRLPTKKLDLDALLRMPVGRATAAQAVAAVLAERDEDR